MDDRVEALEALHSSDKDLHFRFIGMAKERQFILNLEFAACGNADEKLRPEEYDFMMIKVLELVLAHIRARPNPGLN